MREKLLYSNTDGENIICPIILIGKTAKLAMPLCEAVVNLIIRFGTKESPHCFSFASYPEGWKSNEDFLLPSLSQGFTAITLPNTQ